MDNFAEEDVRLDTFRRMSLSPDNISWFSEKAFRETFIRAINSSAENDKTRPENIDREDGAYSEKAAADVSKPDRAHRLPRRRRDRCK